jgi:hypothetical protein
VTAGEQCERPGGSNAGRSIHPAWGHSAHPQQPAAGGLLNGMVGCCSAVLCIHERIHELHRAFALDSLPGMCPMFISFDCYSHVIAGCVATRVACGRPGRRAEQAGSAGGLGREPCAPGQQGLESSCHCLCSSQRLQTYYPVFFSRAHGHLFSQRLLDYLFAFSILGEYQDLLIMCTEDSWQGALLVF